MATYYAIQYSRPRAMNSIPMRAIMRDDALFTRIDGNLHVFATNAERAEWIAEMSDVEYVRESITRKQAAEFFDLRPRYLGEAILFEA